MLLKRSSWERWKQQQQKLHCGLGAFVENSCYNPPTRSSAPKLWCRVWNFCCNSFPSQKLYRRKIYLYLVGNGSPAQLGTDQFADVLMLLLVVVVIGQTGLLQKKPTTNLSRCCCWGLLSSYACGGYENASIAHSLRIDSMGSDGMVGSQRQTCLPRDCQVEAVFFFFSFKRP